LTVQPKWVRRWCHQRKEAIKNPGETELSKGVGFLSAVLDVSTYHTQLADKALPSYY
jgi:hypothetical protein